MKIASLVEKIHLSHGVMSPRQIDPVAFADSINVNVSYQNKFGCDAMLIGIEDRAEIIVDDSKGVGHSRFSLCHELGHWYLHRGQNIFFGQKNVGISGSISVQEEEANEFAFEFLMPNYMFSDSIQSIEIPSFFNIDELALNYSTTRIHTAIRFVRMGKMPSCLVCYDKEGIIQHWQSGNWPFFLIPIQKPEVVNLIFKENIDSNSFVEPLTEIPANEYFKGKLAKSINLYKHSVFDDTNIGREECEKVLLTLFSYHPSIPAGKF